MRQLLFAITIFINSSIFAATVCGTPQKIFETTNKTGRYVFNVQFKELEKNFLIDSQVASTLTTILADELKVCLGNTDSKRFHWRLVSVER